MTWPGDVATAWRLDRGLDSRRRREPRDGETNSLRLHSTYDYSAFEQESDARQTQGRINATHGHIEGTAIVPTRFIHQLHAMKLWEQQT